MAPEGVAASLEGVLLDLVPLVVNLLMGINVASQNVLVGSEQSNGRVELVNKEIRAVCSFQDSQLFQVGLGELWKLFPVGDSQSVTFFQSCVKTFF